MAEDSVLRSPRLVDNWEHTHIDTTVAHPARMYDYYLGGKDNYPADREAAERVIAAVPEAREMARANRDFLGRAVRFLAGQGVTQFLDIGTGIPGPGSTSETAHAVAPDARIVYVDNDPIVLTHSRALLADRAEGRTTVVQADLREPESILAHPDVRGVLDFSRPIAVLLVAVLHFVTDEYDAVGIVERLKQALVPGSHLVLSHITGDLEPERARQATRGYEKAAAPLVLRTHKEIEGFFDGLELLEPGVVQCPLWRPDGAGPVEVDQSMWMFGGVGRKS